jgi:hypothetical protein
VTRTEGGTIDLTNSSLGQTFGPLAIVTEVSERRMKQTDKYWAKMKEEGGLPGAPNGCPLSSKVATWQTGERDNRSTRVTAAAAGWRGLVERYHPMLGMVLQPRSWNPSGTRRSAMGASCLSFRRGQLLVNDDWLKRSIGIW